MLCLSETWLHVNSLTSMVDVPGYMRFRKDRVKGRVGGVLLRIHLNL